MQLECVMVVCADDPKLLDKLDKAAEEGEELDVTNIELTSASHCSCFGSRASYSFMFLSSISHSSSYRFESPGHSCGASYPHSTASSQIGASLWVSPSRVKAE